MIMRTSIATIVTKWKGNCCSLLKFIIRFRCLCLREKARKKSAVLNNRSWVTKTGAPDWKCKINARVNKSNHDWDICCYASNQSFNSWTKLKKTISLLTFTIPTVNSSYWESYSFEKLVVDQDSFTWLMNFTIFMTCFLDNVLEFWWELRSWSPWRNKFG